MAYESEVRRQTRILEDAVRSASRERSRVGSDVDDARRWWKGKGGEAFAEEYRNVVDREAGDFLRRLGNAADRMNSLPSLIQRAERERRMEAERKAAEAEAARRAADAKLHG